MQLHKQLIHRCSLISSVLGNLLGGTIAYVIDLSIFFVSTATSLSIFSSSSTEDVDIDNRVTILPTKFFFSCFQC